MCLEAEHRTEAADKLRANPGGGAENYFSFFHAPEIEVLTLRIVCNTLRDEVAFGNREGWAAVRRHRRGVANCGKNLLKLASTTQFREERLSRWIEAGVQFGHLSEPLHRLRPLFGRRPGAGHLIRNGGFIRGGAK